jgi:hypothetical protein
MPNPANGLKRQPAPGEFDRMFARLKTAGPRGEDFVERARALVVSRKLDIADPTVARSLQTSVDEAEAHLFGPLDRALTALGRRLALIADERDARKATFIPVFCLEKEMMAAGARAGWPDKALKQLVDIWAVGDWTRIRPWGAMVEGHAESGKAEDNDAWVIFSVCECGKRHWPAGAKCSACGGDLETKPVRVSYAAVKESFVGPGMDKAQQAHALVGL